MVAMAERSANAPRQEDYGFDLTKVFASMVSVRSHIPEDAHTASILGTERGGNGIVIREEGVVLTIGYLVTEAETIWLTDHTGNAVQGHVLGYDQETGFGLIQALGRLNVQAIEIGRSADVREGDPVILAGFGGRSSSISAEVIAVREFAGYWEYLLDEAIFTAPAHPNWGGAGLIGANGELLGVGSLFIQHGGADGEAVDGNMVVPIDLLAPIYDEMVTLGRPNKKPRPYMGLFGTEVEDRVVVAALSDNGPADQAEVEVGDIILAVSGQPVTSLADMFRKVWSLGHAGIEVPLALGRDGEIIQANLETIARSDLLKGPKLH
ncbi:MAG: serine protease [Alphaproteobacteria bacterium]|jgi:S1-C subfamily serine protease|nr:serine protease [Alphaproteobacteria bacterium]